MGIHKGTKLTDNPKDKYIQVRMDEQTEGKLNFLTKKLDLTKSEVIRKGIAEQYKAETEK